LHGKIIIAGSGRAGTSFLVQLLTHAGLDTGWTPDEDGFNPEIRAGCEYPWPPEPSRESFARMARVLKSPEWSFRLREYVERGYLEVDHVFIPVRDLRQAAHSRIEAGLYWGVDDASGSPVAAQEEVLARALGRLMETVVVLDLPHTYLRFPDLVDSADYCYSRLCEGLPELRGERWRERFPRSHAALAKPESVRMR
jgi:hypothetical protein